jgi:hypothetical protein
VASTAPFRHHRAGDGNRTRIASLEDWGSAIELRPRSSPGWHSAAISTLPPVGGHLWAVSIFPSQTGSPGDWRGRRQPRCGPGGIRTRKYLGCTPRGCSPCTRARAGYRFMRRPMLRSPDRIRTGDLHGESVASTPGCSAGPGGCRVGGFRRTTRFAASTSAPLPRGGATPWTNGVIRSGGHAARSLLAGPSAVRLLRVHRRRRTGNLRGFNPVFSLPNSVDVVCDRAAALPAPAR